MLIALAHTPLEVPGLLLILGGAAITVTLAFLASAVLIHQSFVGDRVRRLTYGSVLVLALPAALILRSALWGALEGFI